MISLLQSEILIKNKTKQRVSYSSQSQILTLFLSPSSYLRVQEAPKFLICDLSRNVKPDHLHTLRKPSIHPSCSTFTSSSSSAPVS